MLGPAKLRRLTETIVAVEDAGIRASAPLTDFAHRTASYGQDDFVFDPERDEYRCPQGHPRRRYSTKHMEGVVAYRADPAICNVCLVKAECTASDQGRIVHRSFSADDLDRVRGYHTTESYEKAMRKRTVWVEPLFAEAKDWNGLRRLRLPGLENANIHGVLIAAGQNLTLPRRDQLRSTPCAMWQRHGPLAGAMAAGRRLRVSTYPAGTGSRDASVPQ